MSYPNANDFSGNVILGNQEKAQSQRSRWNNDNNNNSNNNNTNNRYYNSQPVASFQTQRKRTDQFDRSLMPLSLKRILMAPEPEDDEPLEIDGKPVHQIEIICTIESIQFKQTHTLFVIEDYGIKMAAKLWSAQDDDVKQVEQLDVSVNDVVKIIGRIERYKNKRSINIHHISKVTDFNVMHLHGFEQILSMQLNQIMVNKHIGSYKNVFDQYIEQETKNYHDEQRQYKQNKIQQTQSPSQQHRYNDNNNNNNNAPSQPPSQQHPYNNNNNNSNNAPFIMTSNHENILSYLRNNTDADEIVGLSAAEICSKVNLAQNRVEQMLGELEKSGFIFNSIPGHFCVTPSRK